MKQQWLSIAFTMAMMLGGSSSFAQNNALAQAKTLFNAGAQAYDKGQFDAAIQAFEQAYVLAPRAGILFSMAQAHRRQYFVAKQPEHLKKAIALYHQYLKEVPTGGRRADVAQALAELEPLAARLESMPPDQTTSTDPAQPPQPPPKPQTRLMVSSQAADARVSVDGKEAVEAPLIQEVTPGKHKIKVTATGYFIDEREIVAADGGVTALDIALREKPALLTIATEDKAQLSVDGRLIGTTPLIKPLELTAGRHLISIAKNGRRAFTREIDLARGERRTETANLDTTTQRYVSFVLVGLGISGAVVGGIFAALAFRQESIAQDIQDQATRGNAPSSLRQPYNDAIDAREQFKQFSGGSTTIGVLTAGAGALLYFIDLPSLSIFPREPSKPPAPQKPRDETKLEVGVAPSWVPGYWGGMVTARF